MGYKKKPSEKKKKNKTRGRVALIKDHEFISHYFMKLIYTDNYTVKRKYIHLGNIKVHRGSHRVG